MRLPLCLWHRVFFKQVGDACGGYLGVDEEVTSSGRRSMLFGEFVVGDSFLS